MPASTGHVNLLADTIAILIVSTTELYISAFTLSIGEISGNVPFSPNNSNIDPAFRAPPKDACKDS